MAQLLAQQAAAAGIQTEAPSLEKAPEEAPSLAKAPAAADFDESDPSSWGNPGRNDPCPCGSGEKFKHCHGKLA